MLSFQWLAAPLDFRARETLVAVIHCFELAGINRNARLQQKPFDR